MTAVPPYVSPEQNANGRASSANSRLRDAKPTKLCQLLDAQDVMMKDMTNPDLSTRERCDATRAWDIIEERIRILRGKTKAGSRNISVREPHPSELRQRQLAKPPASEDLSALYHQHVATPPPATPQE